MRNSSSSGLLLVLIAAGLGILLLFLLQSAWLTAVRSMVTNQPTGMPEFSSTPIVSSFPTSRALGHVGEGLMAGKTAIYVNGIIRPANGIVGNGSIFNSLKDHEEYLWVDVTVNCLSGGEACHVTEFDFGLRTASGREVTPEFSSSFSDVNGLFEGGEIADGSSASGGVVFIIHHDDSGLVLYYPRMFAVGNNLAEFMLDQ